MSTGLQEQHVRDWVTLPVIRSRDQLKKRLVAISILAGLCCCGCTSSIHTRDDLTDRPDKRQLCEWMIDGHRIALESVFESEVYAVSYSDRWHEALKSLNVATTDLAGNPIRPGLVLQSAIDRLAHVRNMADRQRLEYFLFGNALSLSDRMQFDTYCSVAAP